MALILQTTQKFLKHRVCNSLILSFEELQEHRFIKSIESEKTLKRAFETLFKEKEGV